MKAKMEKAMRKHHEAQQEGEEHDESDDEEDEKEKKMKKMMKHMRKMHHMGGHGHQKVRYWKCICVIYQIYNIQLDEMHERFLIHGVQFLPQKYIQDQQEPASEETTSN